MDVSKIHHIFIGNPSAKTIIIFLHEGLGSIAQWRSYPEIFCKKNDCYGLVYDRTGYGKSPGDLTERKANYLHLAAEELHGIVEQAVPEQYKIILYGHSDGGSIALIYAALYPNNIKGIITEAAHVFNEPETIEGVKAAQKPFSQGRFNGLQKYHGSRYKEVFWAWNKIWLDSTFEKWNITAMLPYIAAPQLIIQGLDDQYGTLKQVDTIVKNTKGKTITFTPANCGHAPHKEKLSETLATASAFLVAIDT